MEYKKILEDLNKKVEDIENLLKQDEPEETQPPEEPAPEGEEAKKQDDEDEEEEKPEEEEKQDEDVKQALSEIKTMLSELKAVLNPPTEEEKQGDVGAKPVNPSPEGGDVKIPKPPATGMDENKPETDKVRLEEKMKQDILKELKKELKIEKVTTPRVKVEKSQYDITKGDEDFALKVARGEAKFDVNDLRYMEAARRDQAFGKIFG